MCQGRRRRRAAAACTVRGSNGDSRASVASRRDSDRSMDTRRGDGEQCGEDQRRRDRRTDCDSDRTGECRSDCREERVQASWRIRRGEEHMDVRVVDDRQGEQRSAVAAESECDRGDPADNDAECVI